MNPHSQKSQQDLQRHYQEEQKPQSQAAEAVGCNEVDAF